MEPREYVVENINGDYADLRRTDRAESAELFSVAMALLPQGTDIGTKLRWEMMEYTIIHAK